jgi:hypothetical protein
MASENGEIFAQPDPNQPLTIVPPLQFEDSAGALVFAPLPTITTYELALCTTLFLRLMMWRSDAWGEPAWRGFIMSNGLERHFIAPTGSSP